MKAWSGVPWRLLALALLAISGAAYATDVGADSRTVQLPVVEGKDVRFTHLTSEQLQRSVEEVLQDDQGFIWFGTRDGLKRYDGYRIREFRSDPDDPHSLSGNRIWAIFKDRSGNLWVGTDPGLDRYDPVGERFIRYRAEPAGSLEGPIYNIYQDREGVMWLATLHGLNRFDPATRKTVRYQHALGDSSSLSNNSIKSTLEERDGTFWVATAESLDVFDRKSGKVTRRFSMQQGLEAGRVHLFEDSAGVVWASSESSFGLTSIDRSKNRITHYELGSGAGAFFSAIHEDADGNLWMGTANNGLFKLDQDRQRFVHYGQDPSNPRALSSGQVLALCEDKEGNIWAGTIGGVDRFPSKPSPFRTYQHEPGNPNSLAANRVQTVFEDSHGSLWVSARSELNRLDPKTGKIKKYRTSDGTSGTGNSVVRSIAEDSSGALWLGTYSGLNRLDLSTGNVTSYHHDPSDPLSLSDDNVPAVFFDSRGVLWAGTMGGLNSFDPKTGRFRRYIADTQRQASYYVIAEDAQGTLWLGTLASGLQSLDPRTGKFTIYRHSTGTAGTLSSDEIEALYIDRAGIIWIGTPNGLNRFDPASGAFSVYRDRDGLPNNNVNGILEDGRGNLWLSTNNGLSRFDPRAKKFTNYYSSDGLVRNDFNGPHSGWKSATGELFFNSYGGLVGFFPEEVIDNSFVPPVVLTDFQLFGKPAPIGETSPLKQSITLTRSLTLSHGQNVFSLEFSALSYVSPEQNRFRYQLEGLETAWNEMQGSHGLVTYTTLAPGDYVFRVQGTNNRGVWNEQGVALQIHILPAWWQTWWFRLLAGAALSLAIAGAYLRRLRGIERHFQSVLKERVAERTRIARELHDTLLQSVHGLMFRLQAVRNMLPRRPEEAIQALDSAIDRVEQAAVESRDAIQNLRHETVGQGDITELLTTLGQDLARAQDANGSPSTFRITVTGPRRALPAALQDEIYRIGHELLQNAFRHAHASRIEVELHYGARIFGLSVSDDGKGIDPRVLDQGGSAGHWGLLGIRERAKEIGARLDIRSEPGTGTEIQLFVPFHGASEASGGGFKLFRKREKTYGHKS